MERQSSDYPRLQRLDRFVVAEGDAFTAVAAVCAKFDVHAPDLRFHARRSPFTGATELARTLWIARGDADLVARYEMNGRRRLRENGAIRLGRTTTLMTLAHELGHHLVNWLDPESTASHGYVWIQRFDEAAEVLEGLMVQPSSIAATMVPSSGRYRTGR